jgi:preprotein translocase subunit YajC
MIAQNVKNYRKSGHFETIAPKNLKVGDTIVKKNNMLFADITKIKDNVITIQYVEDSTRYKWKRKEVQSSFLRVVPEKLSLPTNS